MVSSQENDGKTVSAFGLKTYYYDEGAGSPVVLLHGSGPGVSAWTNWRQVIPAFSPYFRIIAPDLAGFGYTERSPDFSYDIKNWGKHFLAFLDALGLDKVNVVGNSFGGSLALATAARYPDRFSRICLMGTPCDKFEMTPGLRAGWDYTPDPANMRRVMEHFPFDPSVISDELVEERYRTSIIPGAQEGLRKLLVKPNDDGPTILSGMPESVAASIRHPTLILHGREDRVIPVEMGIKLARNIPNADLHMFGKCGHWVQAERFEEFVSLASRHFGSEAC